MTKMKKIACLCMSMFLMLGLTGCSSKKEEDKPKKDKTVEKTKKKKIVYTKGKVEGNHFESAWMNMQADFSDQYIMATEEEISQLQSQGSDMMGLEGMEESASQTVINEMMAVGLSGIPNCSVIVEKLALKNMTAKQYLEVAKQQLLNSMTDDFKVGMRSAITTVKIAEEDFSNLHASILTGGVSLYSDSYVRIKDGRAIVINVTYNETTKAQKDEILATFKPIKTTKD